MRGYHIECAKELTLPNTSEDGNINFLDTS